MMILENCNILGYQLQINYHSILCANEKAISRHIDFSKLSPSYIFNWADLAILSLFPTSHNPHNPE
jgi:hypothetical protein